MTACSHDFRSDTITNPTKEMMEAITNSYSALGDAVYEEDTITTNFESRIKELTGHEAAVFAVSGTMTNQLAIRSHLFQPPHSILCDHRAHVYTCEAGGIATLSQAMVTPVIPSNGIYMTLEDIKAKIIVGEDVHVAPTKLICLENTMGGARLWNASIATGVSMREYGSLFDSISLCLSKGLCAPVGSVLVGSKKLIKTATWFKKQAGGGIRQSGILTSAANVALDQVWPSMAKTHATAKEFANFVTSDLGLKLLFPADTNFVYIDETDKFDSDVFVKLGAERGIKLLGGRIVFHYHTSPEAIETLKEVLQEAIKQYSGVKEDKLKTSGYI
ncbi:Hydroxytrimethyllysine aldolase, putative [Yarrowia lipolytica]|nr:Hydroxytrimethyllysine aldolase, putative [Yarrowia lipolytica]